MYYATILSLKGNLSLLSYLLENSQKYFAVKTSQLVFHQWPRRFIGIFLFIFIFLIKFIVGNYDNLMMVY